MPNYIELTLDDLKDEVWGPKPPTKEHHPCPECPDTSKILVRFEGKAAVWRCRNRHERLETEYCVWCSSPPTTTRRGQALCAVCAADFN